MPITVVYLKDHEENKKGDRARMNALPFVRLKKQGIVKRVMTTPADFDMPVNKSVPDVQAPKPKPKPRPKAKQKPKKKKK